MRHRDKDDPKLLNQQHKKMKTLKKHAYKIPRLQNLIRVWVYSTLFSSYVLVLFGVEFYQMFLLLKDKGTEVPANTAVCRDHQRQLGFENEQVSNVVTIRTCQGTRT